VQFSARWWGKESEREDHNRLNEPIDLQEDSRGTQETGIFRVPSRDGGKGGGRPAANAALARREASLKQKKYWGVKEI